MNLLQGIAPREAIDNVILNNASIENVYANKHVAIRVAVAATCLLSMVGALFVAFSYLCFKDLRTQARQILLNLSLMDFGVGLANLFGIAFNFDRFYVDIHTGAQLDPAIFIDHICKAQAFIAFFSTYASVFWTISLAVYMYLLIFQDLLPKYKGLAGCFLAFCYVLNYGLAGGVCLWLLLMNRFGHSLYGSAGWCTIVVIEQKYNYLAFVISYDLWIYLAIILCSSIYVSIFIHLFILRRSSRLKEVVSNKQYWANALHFLDYKLVFIPAIFILLRMWTCIYSFLFVYLGKNPVSLSPGLSLALMLLSGIGDSGQGAANGLLFVVFTSTVRNLFLNPMKKCCRGGQVHIEESEREKESLITAGRKDCDGVLTPSASLNVSQSQEWHT